MKRLTAVGIFMFLLCGSGYVSNGAVYEVHASHATSIAQFHLDPHVTYYEQHLINMGIIKRDLSR
ncbi:MAG TPA: hypothetical protein VKF40_12950 [Burkholderiales bacterium]|nr:hypothetical protein [Burkholderiales bacterium]